MMMPLMLLQSSVRPEYDSFFWSLFALCSVVATGIAGFLVFCAWRYRRKDPDELPSQNALNIPAEVTWIVLPLLFFMVMFYFGVKLYFDMERPPDDAEQVYVVAKQWMWKLQHMDGQREINELHVPVGRAIRLSMISQDAIHSFYAPAFRIKQDVLPARYTTIWFKADRPGRYHLFCAEYCGTNHSQMTGWIYVLSAPDYQKWVEQGGAEGSLASTGEKLFHQYGCSNCHHEQTQSRGPRISGLFGSTVQLSDGSTVTADENYIRESILNPRAKVVQGFVSLMPTFRGQIDEESLIALIAYIKAIGNPRGTQPVAAAGQLQNGQVLAASENHNGSAGRQR